MKKLILFLFLGFLSFDFVVAQSIPCDIKNTTSKKESHYWDNAIIFGGGVEFGFLTAVTNENVKYWGLNLSFYNTFITFDISEYDSQSNIYHGFKIGHYVNVLNFGKYDEILHSYSDQFKIAPFVECFSYTNVSGHYLHKHTEYHHCQVYIDTSTIHAFNKTNIGFSALYRHKWLYVEARSTLSFSSYSVSLGACF